MNIFAPPVSIGGIILQCIIFLTRGPERGQGSLHKGIMPCRNLVMNMGKKSEKSRKRAVKRLFHHVKTFFAALYWLMGFVLTALLLWEKLRG